MQYMSYISSFSMHGIYIYNLTINIYTYVKHRPADTTGLKQLNDTKIYLKVTFLNFETIKRNQRYSFEKKIGYNINVLQQTACLVVNPITVGNFAFLFNCTLRGRTSDSMMVPT